MIDIRAERRFTAVFFWALAIVAGVILLTSCSPFAPRSHDVTTATPAATVTATTGNTVLPVTPTPRPSCTVTTGYDNGRVNFRSRPSTAAAVIRVISEGETLTVIERGEWMKVTTRNTTGFIYGRYCKL